MPNGNLISARTCIHATKVSISTLGPFPGTWMLNGTKRFEKCCWVSRYPNPVTALGFPSSKLTEKYSSRFVLGSPVASGCLFKRHCRSTLFLLLYGKPVVEVAEYPDYLFGVLDWADLSEHWVCCSSSDWFAFLCVCTTLQSPHHSETGCVLCGGLSKRERTWSQILYYCSGPQLE